MAFSYCMAAAFNSIDYIEGGSLGEQYARKAIALDPNDAETHARLALALMVKGEHEASIQEADYAISLNGNCAEAFGIKGAAMIFSGRREEGREALRHFLSASPRDPMRPMRAAQMAASYYFDHDYGTAIEVARQVLRQFPKQAVALRYLAAALGQLGRPEEAADVLQTIQATTPLFVDQLVKHRITSLRSPNEEHLLDGLRKAGLAG